eukprot:TRINITY_DN24234_c0_g3_i1.p1 TRINITY_DN24234_c0_g3~~TRINITY_DN24234_c0_g3_i1.p1  ORF type:complete len:1051 (+),score=217.26 TRINITY_DN24234_c0_g3_i1:102-3254(+)
MFQDGAMAVRACGFSMLVLCAAVTGLLFMVLPVVAVVFGMATLPCALCMVTCGRRRRHKDDPMSSRPLLDSTPGLARLSRPVLSSEDPQALHRSSAAECECLLQLLRQGAGLRRTAQVDMMYRCAIAYRNRWVDGTLLHYAIWRSSRDTLAQDLAEVHATLRSQGIEVNQADAFNQCDADATAVQLVLNAGADILARASSTTSTAVEQVEAVHLAAGYGCVPALQALLSWARPPAGEKARLVQRPVPGSGGNALGCPLTEAAWHGQVGAMAFLLENEADPNSRDYQQKTALHLLAFRGGDAEHVSRVVRALVSRRADLDAQTGSQVLDIGQAGKTPLELASLPGSRFPPECLYLLTQGYHVASKAAVDHAACTAGGGREVSLFDELLSTSTRGAAEQLARDLLRMPECHNLIRMNAQAHDGANKMANLVYVAPLAAVDILQILMVPPEIPDPMNSPLATHASLHGFLENVPMRCTYQTDVTRESPTKPRWPRWFIWAGDERPWQHEFLEGSYRRTGGRQESLYAVAMKVLLLPNAVDLDILWALARTWAFYSKIFLKLPVQGLITCVWTNVVEPCYFLDLGFKIVELASLALLVLVDAPSRWPAWSEEHPRDAVDKLTHRSVAAVCWTVLGAAVLRELLKWMRWFFRFWAKSVRWRQYDCADDPEFSAGRRRFGCVPQLTKSLWSMRSFFGATTAVSELLLSILPLAILLWDMHTKVVSELGVRDDFLLALNVFSRCVRIMILARYLPGLGRKIVAIQHTFLAGNMVQMLGMAAAIFGSFLLAFRALDRSKSLDDLGWKLYRGLLFGDGDGLDMMEFDGYTPEENAYHHMAMSFVGFMGSILFYVIILNMIIAVYEREYTRTTSQSLMMFHQLRASVACKYIMELGLTHPEQRFLSMLPLATPVCWALVLLMACVGVGLPVAQPWNFHAALLGACLLCVAQLCAQVSFMRTPWMPPDRVQDRFLWICHRADFDERRSHCDNQEVDLDDFESAMEELDRRFERLEKRVDHKLDTVLSLLRGGRSAGAPMPQPRPVLRSLESQSSFQSPQPR